MTRNRGEILKPLLLTAFAFSTCLFADGIDYREFPQDTAEYVTEEDSQEDYDNEGEIVPADDEVIIIPELTGVLLVSDWCDSDGDIVFMEGLGVRNVDVPDGLARLRRCLEPMFMCQPLTKKLIIDLKREIILYYRKHGRPLVDVKVPPQDISCGVLRFIVTEGRVGRVISECNEWFPNCVFIDQVSARPGDPIITNELLDDVAWMNRNPFHHTDVFLSPGECEGLTDIELVTRDRFPVRIYTGADNTGNDLTGRGRFFAGLTWGNAFGLDHLLSYQGTVSNHIHEFHSHTGQYVAPLPWKHVLEFFGGYAKVEPHLHDMHHDGHSSQASVRYRMPIKPLYTNRLIDFTLGFDFKNTNNNVLFVGENELPVVNDVVNITQFMAALTYGKDFCCNLFSATLEYFVMPGPMVGDQSNKDFEKMRFKAKNHYMYGRITINSIYRLPYGFSLAGQVRGQFSNQNLLPSEQFGLGGFDTVRGYEQREISVDNALCVNLELRSPPYNFLDKWDLDDEMILLLFLDYGLGNNNHKLPGERNEWLMGIGPGLRYNINPFMTARVDYGFKIHKTHLGFGGTGRVEAGIVVSY